MNLAINCGVLFYFVFKGLHLAFKDKPRANFLLERANLKKKKAKQSKNPQCFACGAVVNNQPANAGDTGLIPGLGRPHVPWDN